MKHHPLAAAALAALTALTALAGATATWAADTSKIPTTLKFAVVKADIADDKWVAAIDELKRMNEPADADWNNLMGYTHRRAKKPDYAAAEKYYTAALAIDPKHKGALEYSGEMYLVLGNLQMAEQRLAALDQVCNASCFEYGLLKKAIDDYKANGNKYVQPAP